MKEIAIIKEKYASISGELNERSKRIWAASEANAIGHGGVTIVHKATNISRSTIHIGKKEILEGQSQATSRIRKQGGGRKSLESQNSDLIKELEAIADENSGSMLFVMGKDKNVRFGNGKFRANIFNSIRFRSPLANTRRYI